MSVLRLPRVLAPSTMRLVFLLVAVLVAAIWALVAREFGGQYQRYRITEELMQNNETVDHLVLAGRDLIFERGRVNIRLAATGGMDEASTDFIGRMRQSSDQHLRAALVGLPQDMAAELSDRLLAVASLRGVVDAQLQLPLSRRDPALRERWFSVSTALIANLQYCLHLSALRTNRFDPAFRLITRIKLSAFSLRDVLGEESTRIGAASAGGEELDGRTLHDLARLRGKADALLVLIRNDIEAAGQPDLRVTLNTVEVALFERLRPLQDEIVGRSLDHRPITLPASSYSSVAVPTLEAVIRLFDTAQEQSTLLAETIRQQALRLMLIGLAMTVFALVLGFLVLFILQRRLLGPLREIGADLRNLLSGGYLHLGGGSYRDGDALDDLRTAVTAFRDILSDRQALWDALPDLIILKDETGGWRALNGVAITCLGVTAEAVLGLTDEAVARAFPHLRSWLNEAAASDALVWQNKTVRTSEEVIVRPDGKTVFFQVVRIPLFHADGRRRSQAVVGYDITDRRLAEAATARLSRQNQLILECAGEGISGVDAEGRTIFFNPAASRMTGWDAQELIGLPQHAILHHSHPDGSSYPAPDCPVSLTLADAVPRHCEHDLFWCKDGSSLPVEFTVNPLVEQGEVRGAVIIFRDIRARLAAETEIQSLLSELQRSNKELERFAYVASHDLRQPLRMISGYMSLLKKRLDDGLGGDEQTFFAFAIDGAKRMDRMICDLLDYSRIGRSGERESVDLSEVVDTARASLVAAIADAGAEITVAPNLPRVMGIRSELERLFQNLLANAIKFRALERPPQVVVDCHDDGGFWHLSVKDNGIGIAPEDHDRLFAIFQRLVPQEQYDGTGIGLASVRKIAEHHGGRVWVESELGQGATFFVALPKAATDAPRD